MQTAVQQQPCDAVKFEPNLPQRCALKYRAPKIISGKWGERAMYSLTDGRLLFLDTEQSETIARMDIQPGEFFYVCKRWNGDRNQKARWDIWLDPVTEKARAKDEESEIAAQIADSIALAEVRKNGNGANGSFPNPSAPVNAPATPQKQAPEPIAYDDHTSSWATYVRQQTQIKLTIYHQLCEWAKANFPNMTRREVSSFLMNVLISSEKGARR